MKGSEKQVAWAEDIRAKMLASIASDRAERERLLAAYGQVISPEAAAASKRIEDAIGACESAKTLIEARNARISVWDKTYSAEIDDEWIERTIARLRG